MHERALCCNQFRKHFDVVNHHHDRGASLAVAAEKACVVTLTLDLSRYYTLTSRATQDRYRLRTHEILIRAHTNQSHCLHVAMHAVHSLWPWCHAPCAHHACSYWCRSRLEHANIVHTTLDNSCMF